MIFTLLILHFCDVKVPVWLWVIGWSFFALQVVLNVVQRIQKERKVKALLQRLQDATDHLHDVPPPQGRYD